jgi:hypothetical protein
MDNETFRLIACSSIPNPCGASGAGIARAGDAGPGSLDKEEKRNAFRTYTNIPISKVFDALPTLDLLLSDSSLSTYLMETGRFFLH